MRLLILALTCLALSSAAGAQVLPRPHTWSESPGVIGARRFESTVIHCSEPDFRPQIAVLVEGLGQLGVGTPESGPREPEARIAALTIERRPLDPGITYSIRTTPRGLHVTASTEEGIAHAVTTLLQIVEPRPGGDFWPAVEIEDGPDFPYRSFMVDLGRNPHRPETLRRVVDMMAFTKANYLHLHLTDDQIISWPSRAFPKLWSKDSGWTWKDFEALEEYSQARGVTVIPEVDVPGHSTLLRRAYPEVFGETPTDLARLESARRGLETLLDEMMSVFVATPYIHIGGDEAYGVPEDLQRDFINKLNRFVKSRGKRTVVWEGPRLGIGDNKVDEDVLHINWRTINFPAPEMLEAGYQVVNAAWDPLYIVDHYPRTMFTAVDLERCYAWDATRFAHVNHDIATFAEPIRTETNEGILGFCMPWWEGREENLLPLCLDRLFAVASAAWNRSGEDDFGDFQTRLESAHFRLAALTGIRMRPVLPAHANTQDANVAFLARVTASSGASQPHFGPARLTNGITERFDHFLGFPTQPEPLEITIRLQEPSRIGRVVIHETAVGASYEVYELLVSTDGEEFDLVGSSAEGTRGESAFVEHPFSPREVSVIRIRTHGCHGLTFPSFSRLTEVQAFAE